MSKPSPHCPNWFSLIYLSIINDHETCCNGLVWHTKLYIPSTLNTAHSAVGEGRSVNFFLSIRFLYKKVLWYIEKWLVTIKSTHHDPIIWKNALLYKVFKRNFKKCQKTVLKTWNGNAISGIFIIGTHSFRKSKMYSHIMSTFFIF